MRLTLALFLATLTTPAFADTKVGVTAASPEAAADTAALVAALQAGLAGAHKGCPVTVAESGNPVVTVTYVAGPPAGWSATMGTDYAATGAAGDVAGLATGILDKLCPKQGGAATLGPWTASGGGSKINVTGQVADLLATFTLEGEFPGGRAVFEYTPVNIGGGAVSYTLSGSGVTGSGEGIYSLKEQGNGVYALEQMTEGCVDGIANSCRTNSETITLTPTGQ